MQKAFNMDECKTLLFSIDPYPAVRNNGFIHKEWRARSGCTYVQADLAIHSSALPLVSMNETPSNIN